MNRFITVIVAACFAWSVQAAETDTVTEGFACNLKPGKTMADFDKVTAFWQTQMDKIPGGDETFAAVLTPLRADTPVDLFWLGSEANLNAWAKNTAAYYASAEGRAAETEFDKVVSCESGLWFSWPVHEGLPPATVGGTSVIEAYQCKLKHGRNMANVENAHAKWRQYVDAAKSTDPSLAKFSAYMLMPWLARTEYDLVYLVVNETFQDFGKLNTAAMTGTAGPAVQAAFDAAMTCEGGLFTGKVVRTPAVAE
jgi:hypothetical protein